MNFHADCEAAINEQINVEYNISYVYHALFAYFDRDNVALPGFAKFFKDNSSEEREHAELLWVPHMNMCRESPWANEIMLPRHPTAQPETRHTGVWVQAGMCAEAG